MPPTSSRKRPKPKKKPPATESTTAGTYTKAALQEKARAKEERAKLLDGAAAWCVDNKKTPPRGRGTDAGLIMLCLGAGKRQPTVWAGEGP